MMMRSELYALVYSGDVPGKLTTAQEFYASYGRVLATRQDISGQLSAMLVAERALQEQMGMMAMGSTCRHCAGQQGGGCCSRYMAGENDVLQLLMNMLAGVEVTVQQQDMGHCCFLGVAGCVLSMKSMFCLNYNCNRIKGQVAAATMLLLEQRTGDLLRKQAVLEELLVAFFCDKL